jgi:sec-independent protein translocase protein TatA
MLGLDNPLHLLFLLGVLLLVFGAKRLPEIGRSLGSGLRGFKESISGEIPAHDLTTAAGTGPQPAGETLAQPAPIHPVA